MSVKSSISYSFYWQYDQIKAVDSLPAPGFASAAFLRPLVNIEKEDLISAAVRQWLRFDRGNKSETDNRQVAIVGKYWSAIGLSLDGNDTDQPWSAAFISQAFR